MSNYNLHVDGEIWICQASKVTQKYCSSVVAAYSKVVALVVLFMSHILGTEWYADFAIWRYRQRNISIWRDNNSFCFPRGLLWVSSQSFRCCCCCSYYLPHCLCLSFCILYWETELPKEVNVVKMYSYSTHLDVTIVIMSYFQENIFSHLSCSYYVEPST